MFTPKPIPCPPPKPVKPPPLGFRDPCSFSSPSDVQTLHIHVDMHVDMTARLLTCTAVYDFKLLNSSTTDIVLDSRGINIESISNLSTNEPLSFSISQTSSIGDALSIHLHQQNNTSHILKIKISYTTMGLGCAPAGGAVDWLDETQGGGRPFLFTQAQSIHARSLFPCQDTPAAKAPYSALVTLDEQSRDLQVVMSAQRVPLKQHVDPEFATRFECPVPVPSYLFALAVGKLEMRQLSSRCAVWALPDVVDKAAWEFHDVELFLSTAEKIAGPYVWGRYDLVVLPPSYPYGGMENPMLTFVTPTLLSGDRSLVSVVIHEIAHSWTGNLVSCQDCTQFWINEGFTVKLERRVLRELYGTGREGLDAISGRHTLDNFVKSVGSHHIYTSMIAKVKDGEDPDDYFSCVAYEKGYSLLLLLEQRVKEDYPDSDLDDFFRKYYDRFQYQSISSKDFEDMFKEFFPKTWQRIDFEEWYHGTGGCPELADVDTSLVKEAEKAANDWISCLKEITTDEELIDENDRHEKLLNTFQSHGEQFRKWDPTQQLCFLDSLSAHILNNPTNDLQMTWTSIAAKTMDEIYGFNSLRNSEMRMVWCRIALAAKLDGVIENVKDFVSSQGRMKFVRPLFKDLCNVYPKGDFATTLFENVKDKYHSLSRKMIERDLQNSSSTANT